jgi:acetoin utilization protein AcuC
VVPPARMTDGLTVSFTPWDSSAPGNPADPVDRAVLATRTAVFALHGLDPA